MKTKVLFFIYLIFFSLNLFSYPLSPQISEVIFLLKNKKSLQKKDFKKFGKFGNSLLIDIVFDKNQNDEIRIKAIKALSLFPTKKTKSVLIEIINSPDFPSLFKEEAIISYAKGFQKKAISDIKIYLTNDNLSLRRSAIIAFSVIKSQTAIQILQTSLPHETNFELRLLMEKTIKKIEENLEEVK